MYLIIYKRFILHLYILRPFPFNLHAQLPNIFLALSFIPASPSLLGKNQSNKNHEKFQLILRVLIKLFFSILCF